MSADVDLGETLAVSANKFWNKEPRKMENQDTRSVVPASVDMALTRRLIEKIIFFSAKEQQQQEEEGD